MPDRSKPGARNPTLRPDAAPHALHGPGRQPDRIESMQSRPRSLPARLAGLLPDPRGRSPGQARVELALVLPVVLLILVAAGDLARVFSTQVSLDTAARAGALEASVHPTSFQANAPCNASTNRVVCAVLTEAGGASTHVRRSDIFL